MSAGRSGFLAGLGLVVASQLAVTEARAQSGAEAIFGLVGGIMAAAQVQAAQDAWSKLPELRQYCFQRGLARHNANIVGLIRAGVLPTDPRLSPVATQCGRFEPGALRANYRCSIPDETGAIVPSTCNQSFARQDGAGRVQLLDVRAAIDLFFSNGDLRLVDVENPAGRQERHQRLEAQRLTGEVARLRAEVERFRASRSDVVRNQTQSLLQRVASASNPAAPPSPSTVEAIRRDAEALGRLEMLELGRLAALEKLNVLKADVERRAAAPTLPQEVRDTLAQLQGDYIALANQSALPPQAPPKADKPAGPTFDCAKAKLPLERVICSDRALSRLDLELLQPYYILRHVLPDQRPALKDEAQELSKIAQQRCGIPDKGNLSQAAIRKAVPCVTGVYREQRDRWRALAEQQAASAARQEFSRSADEHLRLQHLLQTAGFIPGGETVDGIYGGGTRGAISALQMAEKLPADGILSDATAERLLRRAATGGGAALDAGVTARIVDLHRRYSVLAAQIVELDGKRVREEQLAGKLAAGKTFVAEALTLSLPEPIRVRLARFKDEVDQAGPSPDGATLARLTAELDALRPPAEAVVSVIKATTPKNEFLIKGPGEDVVALFNDTGKAPSVVKNLRGELIFEAARTNACQPHPGLTDLNTTRQVNARLARWNQSLRFPLQRCNMRNLTGYDLVIVSRGDMLREKSSDMVALLSAVDSGAFASMFTVSGDDVKAAVQAEAVRVLEIETALAKEAKPGFGMVVMPAAGSGVVCQVTAADREAHDAIAAGHSGRLADETGKSVTFVATSADGAFVAAKRGQCGAIYASGGDLRDLLPALQRDQIAYRILPVWIEPDQIAGAKAALAEKKTRELQQEADRRRRAEDEQRLAAAKANDETAVKARQQAELQQRYGAMARAFEGQLTTEMKDFVEGRSERAAKKYPLVGDWFRGQTADRWELMTVDTALVDYGIAEFKGRSLEAGFARTVVKMRNRILGEYKEHCFITGFISDKEFEMEREPVSARCDTAADTIRAYRQGQRFTSRWLAQ